MSANNSSMTSEPKELNIRAKTWNRRQPTLSHNVTLLIVLGVVVAVVTIVGLVLYFSQRNFKRRSNVHRRRWLESDLTIDNYSDGMVYNGNITSEENQSQSIDMNQDDCPPPYESVIQQSIMLLKKKGQNFTKRSKYNKNSFDGLGKYSQDCDEFKHDTNSIRNSEPLIPSQSSNCISTITTEISLLIENRQIASTSSPEEDGRDIYEERGKYLKDDFKLNGIRNSQSVKVGNKNKTEEKLDIVPTKTLECENEIALLDASGLPSYDTALKIQECGNI